MDMIATEIMRRGVQAVAPNMTLPELEQMFVRHKVWGFPVVEGEHLVGVVSRSDIVRQWNTERQAAQVTSDFYFDADGFHEAALTTDEQVADRVGERMERLTVGDVMHRRLFAVPADQPLRAVAETMLDNKIHRVLVTREGRLLGIITTSDFVRLYAEGRIKPA